MSYTFVQAFRRMKHIRRNDQMILAAFKSLCCRVFFNIQDFIAYKGIAAEFFSGPGKETGRDIGEQVFGPSFRQIGQTGQHT